MATSCDHGMVLWTQLSRLEIVTHERHWETRFGTQMLVDRNLDLIER